MICGFCIPVCELKFQTFQPEIHNPKSAIGKTVLLDTIHSPKDVQKLEPDELQQLADEVRERLIQVVSQTGGDTRAGLGVVELTVALCVAFDSPRDKIVWDVGHQGYPWKILTGRNERLHTLRQRGGLSGFLRRSAGERKR